jgi:glyoxylase-like metal-dependent hydrolase (beta-lactamase superfamily II)
MTQGRGAMRRQVLLGLGPVFAVFLVAAVPTQASAQAPPFETRKITENVYIFRYVGHQSMFVVTPDGVIATDPIGYLRPQAVTTYIAEIRKVTPAPIKYVVYSHHHYDHIAGGKPFKDLGAIFIAHRNAKTRLEALKYPDAVIPDVAVDNLHIIELGGVRVELHYVGRNHSDNSLVMLVPKDKILFTVDFIPIETVQKQYMTDLSDAVKLAADQGKCWDRAMQEIKLPKYEKWGSYDQDLPGNIQRFCSYWGRGY